MGKKTLMRTYAETEANSVPTTTERPQGVGTHTHGCTKLCDHGKPRVDIPQQQVRDGAERRGAPPAPEQPYKRREKSPGSPPPHWRPLLFSAETGTDPSPALAPGRLQALIPGETPLPLFGLGKLSCR